MSVEGGGGGAGADANPAGVGDPGVAGIQDPAVAEAFASTFAAMANAAAACRARIPSRRRRTSRAARLSARSAGALRAGDALRRERRAQDRPRHRGRRARNDGTRRDSIRRRAALHDGGAGGEGVRERDVEGGTRGGRRLREDPGEELVRVVLVAGGSTCPRQILRPLAQLLHAFRGAYQHPVDAWLTATVSSPTFPTAELAAGEGERATFCGLATRTPLTAAEVGRRVRRFLPHLPEGNRRGRARGVPDVAGWARGMASRPGGGGETSAESGA